MPRRSAPRRDRAAARAPRRAHAGTRGPAPVPPGPARRSAHIRAPAPSARAHPPRAAKGARQPRFSPPQECMRFPLPRAQPLLPRLPYEQMFHVKHVPLPRTTVHPAAVFRNAENSRQRWAPVVRSAWKPQRHRTSIAREGLISPASRSARSHVRGIPRVSPMPAAPPRSGWPGSAGRRARPGRGGGRSAGARPGAAARCRCPASRRPPLPTRADAGRHRPRPRAGATRRAPARRGSPRRRPPARQPDARASASCPTARPPSR